MESLAVKYRPKVFSDVCSQQSIIQILTKQLETEQVKNTYLFCGASGCGKTTIARIFANGINKGQGVPIEIDGASNNGVENVKQIIKSASERSIDSKYKVYIVDECHMLTTQAWNAFLKCIEEPPTYTIFIFCTTDPQKIPATILNRCMRFNFNRISSDIIKSRLMYISEQEQFTNFVDTCDYISRMCNGQMRDAISLLEKCASYDTNLVLDNALSALGNYSYDVFFDLINFLIDGNIEQTLRVVSYLYNQGNDLKLFIDQFLSFCLDILKYYVTKDYSVTKIPATLETRIQESLNFENANQYYVYLVDKLLQIKNMLKNDSEIKSTIEVMLINICRCQ